MSRCTTTPGKSQTESCASGFQCILHCFLVSFFLLHYLTSIPGPSRTYCTLSRLSTRSPSAGTVHESYLGIKHKSQPYCMQCSRKIKMTDVEDVRLSIVTFTVVRGKRPCAERSTCVSGLFWSQACAGPVSSSRPCSLAASQITPLLRSLLQSQNNREQNQPGAIPTPGWTDPKP